jgi:hypothetical protein
MFSIFAKRCKHPFILAAVAFCVAGVAASDAQATGLRGGVVLKKSALIGGQVKPVYELAKTFPIPVGFEQAWNKNRAAYQASLVSYVRGVRRNGAHVFDNVVVTMAVDNGILSRTSASIQSENRTFTLRYAVPGNRIDARADTGFFKTVNVRVIFDVIVDVDMSTKGPAANPIVVLGGNAIPRVTSATTIIGNNAMSYITGFELLQAVKGRFNVTDFGVPIGVTNNILRPFTADPNFSLVTPRRAPAGTSLPYDIYFELAPPVR